MQHQAYLVTRKAEIAEFPIYIGTRQAAENYARGVASFSIIPVWFNLIKPFVNTPLDPFVELTTLRLAWSSDEILPLILPHKEQLMNTNHWEEIVAANGPLSFEEMYEKAPDDFMDLPLECADFFTRPDVAKRLVGKGHDGVIFGGLRDLHNDPMYVPYKTAGIRYGEEYYVQ